MTAVPLALEHVARSFGSLEVLRDISLSVLDGEFVALVGPSGCGKTTLLNLLSGFDQPTSGAVLREGAVRMVYQQDSLFPWRTVNENIGLGLQHVPSFTEREAQVRDLLHLVSLEQFGHHYPHQLSGGMRQRAELARALAGDSDILLLDEPFSSLDYLTRLRLRQELARILEERPRTVVLVTHDIEEAAQLADRVVVLTERPAQVRDQLSISAPRPRDPTDSQVVEATRLILAELHYAAGGAQPANRAAQR